MATTKINSDSLTEYNISPGDFIIKLRKNLDGVALAHDDIDNNFEVLRRTINDLHTSLDEITYGDLSSTTNSNLYVDKIKDGSITASHLASGIVLPVGAVQLSDAQKAEIKGDPGAPGAPGATPTFSFADGTLTITNI